MDEFRDVPQALIPLTSEGPGGVSLRGTLAMLHAKRPDEPQGEAGAPIVNREPRDVVAYEQRIFWRLDIMQAKPTKSILP
jgi:hypothetical protein